MKCPDCGFAVDFSRTTCPRCRIDYLQAFERRARDSYLASARVPRVRRIGPALTPIILTAALAGLAAALFYTAALHRSRAPFSGAFQNTKRRFAFNAPPGWRIDGAEEARGGAVRAARIADCCATIEVLLLDSSAPRLAMKDGGLALARTEFTGVEPRVTAVEEVEIDGLKAVRIAVTGGRVMMASRNRGSRQNELQQGAPAYESLEFEGRLIVVPGSGKSYLIKIYSDADFFRREEKLVSEFLDSFRVTEPVF